MIAESPIPFKAVGAYIYIVVSRTCRIAYVGQTHAKGGVVTRVAQHMTPNGTLRLRLADWGYDWDEADDWLTFYYELPREPEFLSLESSYRLAVEYLVQIKLRQMQGNMNPRFRIISKVTATPQVGKHYITLLADEITCHFVRAYHAL